MFHENVTLKHPESMIGLCRQNGCKTSRYSSELRNHPIVVYYEQSHKYIMLVGQWCPLSNHHLTLSGNSWLHYCHYIHYFGLNSFKPPSFSSASLLGITRRFGSVNVTLHSFPFLSTEVHAIWWSVHFAWHALDGCMALLKFLHCTQYNWCNLAPAHLIPSIGSLNHAHPLPVRGT